MAEVCRRCGNEVIWVRIRPPWGGRILVDSTPHPGGSFVMVDTEVLPAPGDVPLVDLAPPITPERSVEGGPEEVDRYVPHDAVCPAS